LGYEHEFTILQLAERVIKLSNSSSRIVRAPLPADDPKQRRPDTSLARERLGWRATTELEPGLKRTIEYFDGLLSSTAKV
jgi:UDP-glucuronate decarboxylase